MPSTSGIIPTAPLHGVDLLGADPVLPHQQPAPVPTLPASELDRGGALASEPGAAEVVADWKEAKRYFLPPRLDRQRTDLEAERKRLASEAAELVTALQEAAEKNGARDRGFQRKTLYASTTGEFRVPVNLPRALVGGPFEAGARHRAIVRFSSAASTVQADPTPDQRAVGVRITDDVGRVQDLTFTSGSAGNHARDARQFNSSMVAARQMARGGIVGRLRALAGLLRREGIRETMRLTRARRSALDTAVSLAALVYYSRSPFQMGSKLVHLALFPIEGTPEELVHEARAARDGLGRDLCMRRTEGDVRFRIAAAEAPCLDDMSRAPDGPWVTVGEINLPRQSTGEAEMLQVAATVHQQLALHPFNVWEEGALTPRGELNELLRGPAYAISARNSGRRDEPPGTPRLGV
jgi:hypothetical protein